MGVHIALNATPSELPKADEIVGETIRRILADEDVWDGEGTLDQFFHRCMTKTMEGLRSQERRHRKASSKFVPDTDTYTGAPLLTGHAGMADRRGYLEARFQANAGHGDR
jgi:DNA-directed RNA polymerase specialized sigma24 family protein